MISRCSWFGRTTATIEPTTMPACTAARVSRADAVGSTTATSVAGTTRGATRFDGRLIEVVDRTSSIRCPRVSVSARCAAECWGGFVFVNFDPDAEPLLDFLEPIPGLLSAYHLERLRFRAYQTTILPANWKVVVDAFNEAYHVQGTHPQLLPWTDDVSIAYEQLGIHAHYGRLPEARRELRPSPRLGLKPDEYDEGEILAGLVGGLGRLSAATSSQSSKSCGAAPRQAGTTLLQEFQARRCELLASRGLDVSDLSLDQMTSADDVYCFPNLVGPIYPGLGDRVPYPSQRPRPRQQHQGHMDARVAAARRRTREVGAALLSRLDREGLG